MSSQAEESVENFVLEMFTCSGSNKASLSPKKILKVDLSYFPNCTERFFIDLRKYEPVSNFRLKRFLYRGGLSGKIYINRFIKTRFVVAGYLLLYKGFSFHFYGIVRNFD